MTTSIPAGTSPGRPGADDAPRIHELISLCDVQVIGKADMTLDDVADQINDPSFDLGTDGLLVHDTTGRLTAGPGRGARAPATRRHRRRRAPRHARADRPALGHRDRAGGITAGLGHDRAVVGHRPVPRGRRASDALAAARGFGAATTFVGCGPTTPGRSATPHSPRA
ncbi:hypothetical protein GCM10017559_77430 [Streptosporangium longisporum]|uniref:Uncharacterized protein n=1 Tax=Streptosporangium longisporum TaxID=46187 RepID=A0ABP6LEK9_9ACTN